LAVTPIEGEALETIQVARLLASARRHQHQVRASRAINSYPGARGKINELVVTSYAV
jgi:hypothetical protein